jgi:hypothetical protein
MSWTTAEVRWFHRGEVPAYVMAWFASADSAVELEPPRVDHYLRLFEREDLGIKLRAGRIEIKQRHASVAVTLTSRACGLVELWQKWGYGVVDEAENEPAPAVDPAWVAVEKRRWMRTYDIAAGGAIEPVPRSLTPQRECSAELTAVRIGDQAWWTLGFEAAGQEETLRPTLEAVAAYVLAQKSAPILDLANSYGYPQWLRLLGA